MIVTRGETYEFKRYPRKEDSPYEFSSFPDIVFKGRPANNMEKRTYRIQQGVNGNSDSVMIFASNLPKEIAPGDKIVFLGKEWSVASTGYYFDEARLVNGNLFNDDYIAARCPKGVVLQ